MGQIRLALFATLDLVGQGRTYDIFAGYWPHQNDAFADVFNRIPKCVVSRGNPDLSWSGSAHIGADLVTEVRELRQRHEHVTVVGSLNLVQTLLRENCLIGWIFGCILLCWGSVKSVRRGRGAVQPDAARAAGVQPGGHCASAVRVGSRCADDGGHERTGSGDV